MRHALRLLAFSIAALASVVTWLLVNPSALFAHEYRSSRLTLRSVAAHDPAHVAGFLDNIEARLDASPERLSADDKIVLHITNGGWREALLFITTPNAGALVYVPFSTRNAYLRRSDLASDTLFKHEFELTPPRTASYFAAHEIAHLLTAKRLGRLEFFKMPYWLREGMADTVALGPMNALEARTMLADPEPWFAHGSYATDRGLVSYQLLQQGVQWADLSRLDISKVEGIRALELWAEQGN